MTGSATTRFLACLVGLGLGACQAEPLPDRVLFAHQQFDATEVAGLTDGQSPGDATEAGGLTDADALHDAGQDLAAASEIADSATEADAASEVADVASEVADVASEVADDAKETLDAQGDCGGTCDAGTCDAATCDDGNLCTFDACGDFGCSHTDLAATCSDGDVCTVGDQCAGGVCMAGSAKACDDGDACTGDACQPTSGCVFTKLGTKVCNDVDECQLGTAACDLNATCTNTVGDYACTCKPGYSGDGLACSDLDECAAGSATCASDALCTNTAGSYSCACKPGYSGNGQSCNDVDECQIGLACSAKAKCTNTGGGYICDCLPGYSGPGKTCDDVDECAAGTSGCHANAACSNNIGGVTCTCKPGYAGDGKACKATAGQQGNPAPTCGAIVTDTPTAASGVYWVDVDGAAGPMAPFQAYCDLTSAGGGWLLVGQQVPGKPFADTTLDYQLANAVTLNSTFRLGNQKLQAVTLKVGWRITASDAAGTVFDNAWFKPACKIDWAKYVGVWGENKVFDDKCGTAYTDGTFAATLGGNSSSFSCAKGIGQNNSGAYCSIRMGTCAFGAFTEGQALPCVNDAQASQTVRLWLK